MNATDRGVVGPVEPVLTTPDFWDEFWRTKKLPERQSALLGRAKHAIKQLLGEKNVHFLTRPYWDYVLWEHLYRRCLPSLTGAKVLEIGSAPGDYLIRLCRTFGCIPYGVEYSPAGFAMNQETFARYGVDPDNVIFADAFSDSFQSKHRGAFDVVISRGVIEHFSDVEPVLAKHCALLKPGGYLVVSVPNFRGLAYLLALIYDRASIKAHNLEIMRKSTFARAFQIPDLEPIFCGHYGVCDLSVCVSGPNAKRGFGYNAAFQAIDKAQCILNGVLRVVMRGKSLESELLSPFLLCVGRRRVRR